MALQINGEGFLLPYMKSTVNDNPVDVSECVNNYIL